MTSPFGSAEIDRFRAVIVGRLGLHFDDSKLGFLVDVLSRRADAAKESIAVYLDRLEVQSARQELRALAGELTVPETYFFRNLEQFRALAEVVVPERMAARAAVRKLRVLSAGCASGEEPYSLAMLLRERVADPSWDVSIRAADINAAMLEKAARARYSVWSLRETPSDMQRRWFEPQGREFVLNEAIRASVTFLERNLANDDDELWNPETYDVVFCRNVIMYFTTEVTQAVIQRITRSLAPGGYLFLGHAETLRGLSSGYRLRHTHGTFYYQRRDELCLAVGAASAAAPAEVSTLHAADLAHDLTCANSWVETVQRASERIQALTARAQPNAAEQAVSSPESAARPVIDLSPALELLKQERFSDALALLEALPAESTLDPEALLLRAALLTHSGQLAAAEHVCAELLQCDELSTGAHYLLALCREGLGDRHRAVDHDQVAVYLDPSFAMPKLHLGLMARRMGDRDGARRELGQALVLLQREDLSRLLLFGGGFGREALVTLCRAELVAAGGRP